MILQLQHL